MEEKKKYTNPCFEIITLELDDIVTTSDPIGPIDPVDGYDCQN